MTRFSGNGIRQADGQIEHGPVWEALALSTSGLSAEEIVGRTRVSGEQVITELNAQRAGNIATRVEFPNGRIAYKLLPMYDHDAPAAAAKKDSR